MIRDNRGLTLIEVLIVIVILGVVMVSIGQLLDSGVQNWHRGETSLEAEQNLRIALERISQDLLGAKGVIAAESSSTRLVVLLPGYIKIEYYLDGHDETGPGGLKGQTLLRVFHKYTDETLTASVTQKTTELGSYFAGINFNYIQAKTDASLIEISLLSGQLPNGQQLQQATGIALRGKFLLKE